MHPLTGTFADPEHAAEFGQTAFRQAFPLHVTFYVVLIGFSVQCVIVSGSMEMRSAHAALALVGSVALGARVAVQRMHDRAEAHRLGAILWTMSTVGMVLAHMLFIVSCVVVGGDRHICQEMNDHAQFYVYLLPVFSIAYALANATHGMEFWHRTALAGSAIAPMVSTPATCGFQVAYALGIGALAATCGICHVVELAARHFSLKWEQMHTRLEHLEYDTQMSDRRAERMVELALHRQRRAMLAPSSQVSAPAVDAPLAGSLLADVTGSSHDHASMPGPSTGIAGPSQAVLGPFDGPTATQQSNQTHQPLFVRPLFELTPEQAQQAMQLHAEQVRAAEQAEADDAASEALSGPEGGPEWGSWSSSDPSEATRWRRKVARLKLTLRIPSIYGPDWNDPEVRRLQLLGIL